MSNDIEWKMVKLGDVAEFLPTNTLSRDELNYSEGEYLNIHYGDVLIKFDSVTDVLNSEIPFVSLNKKFSDKSLLKNGDIVMADTAEDESVGKVTEIQNIDNYKVVSGLHTLCMRFQENLFAPKFAGYYLNSPAFHNLLLPYMHGTKVTSISKGDVKKIVFPIPYKNGTPDLETQNQIAQKLGDMDSLIAAKEKFLAKKRNLKIAAMQKLIKDEESDGWKKVKLGEVCKNFTGLTYSPSDIQAGGTLVLRSSNIKNGFLDFSDNVFVKMIIPKRAIVQKDDILVCVRNGSKSLIGKSALITEVADGMAFGAFMTILRATKINQKFLFYLWQSKSISDQIQNSLGATINQITNADIKRYEVSIPYKNEAPDLTEQRRIASILSDMDSEIDAIEKEITKLQNLKTAMMQKMFCFGDSNSSSE